MSNINGKAYAMNLVTPVYVSTGYLAIFIIPAILVIMKSLTYFSPFSYALIDGWGWGILFLILGVMSQVAGLVRWLDIISKSNKLVYWLCGTVFFVLAISTKLSLFSMIVYALVGVALLIAGLTMMKNGPAWLNRFIFWLAGLSVFQDAAFDGLNTLSLIHYARWVILRGKDFPCLSPDQPKEDLKYSYMFFFSNFNGSWTQYVDSFSVAIPGGLNLLWNKNLGWQNARVETPFNGYVMHNQIDTEYYYNAYPLASSNDIKSAQKVVAGVRKLENGLDNLSAQEFKTTFDKALLDLQADLSKMEPTPIVSLAHEAIKKRKSIQDARD